MDDLPNGRLGLVEDARNLVIAGVEDFAQQEGGTLLGRKPLEQNEECHREVGRELRPMIRRDAGGRDRFGQPRSHVAKTLRLGAPQAIDRETRDDRHEPTFLRDDVVVARLVPAEKRLLHEILRLLHVAQHAIGNAEQPRAKALERVVVRRRGVAVKVHAKETDWRAACDRSREDSGSSQRGARAVFVVDGSCHSNQRDNDDDYYRAPC